MCVFEDEHTLAFMDIAKDVDGHMLVIPKAHHVNILDCDPDTLAHVIRTVKRVSNHLVESCGYESVDLMCANGESAGQTMPTCISTSSPRGQAMAWAERASGLPSLAQSMSSPRCISC